MLPALLACLVIGPAGDITYHQHVLPILRKNCMGCHGGDSPRSDLSLETLDGLKQGGKKGPPLVPGKPGESLLFILASREKKPAMPPKKEDALTADEIEVLRLWIEGGAKPGEPVAAAETSPYSGPLEPPVYPRPPVVPALAYSADGSRLYVAGYREVLVHEAEPEAPGSQDPAVPLSRLLGEAERINALAVSPDGKRLAAAGGSPALFGELQLWSTLDGKLERFVRIGRDTLFAAAFSPDSKRIAVGGTDRAIHLIEVETGKELYASEVHSDWIFGLAFTPDGSRIASGGRDKTVKLSGAADGKFVSTLGSFNEPITSVQARPGTAFVLGSGEGRSSTLFDAKELKEVRKYEGQPGAVLATAFSADGKLFAAGGSGDEVRVLAAEDGARKATFRGHKEWIYAVAFRPDGERLATAGYEGVVRIYGLKDEKERRSFIPICVSSVPSGKAGGN